jgi:protein-S-isoprenylcysteine O-methyltransferase Ste14
LGLLIIEVLGFFFLSLFWRNKAKFLNKDRTTAYQRGLKYVIIGVAMIVSVPVHSIIIFPINEFFLKYSITNLSESLLITIGVVPDIEIFLRLILGFIFLIIGLIGYRRVIITFGIDYMLMLYSYYPDESTIQNHSIYNVVQHPTYLSVIILAFSGFLFNFSFYTLFYLISLFLGIFFVIRRYEEKELKQRFGKPYTDYQKNVPRFIPKRNNFINYFKYLAGKY